MDKKLEVATAWVKEAGTKIKDYLTQPLIIEQKTNRTDLVTNVDKEIERFIVEKIRENYPKDKIIGEEGTEDERIDTSDNVWFIDPIDGTLNFITQHENFCVMLAYYEAGIGKFGIIFDVVGQQFVYGGPEFGVYLNDKQLPSTHNMELKDGLVGVNAYMYANNRYHVKDIADKSLGVRILGCAGLEFIELLKGNQVAYLSNLCPWDYAAGAVLCTALDMIVTHADGQPLTFNGRKPVFGMTQQAHQYAQTYFK